MAVFSARHDWTAPRLVELKRHHVGEDYGFSLRGEEPVIVAEVDIASLAEVRIHLCCPSQHDTQTQCWLNIGPSSATQAQHYTDPMSVQHCTMVCNAGPIFIQHCVCVSCYWGLAKSKDSNHLSVI